MNDFIEKYKIALSVIAGTLFLAAGTYAPLMSSLLLTEKQHEFTTANYVLIGLGIIFLWGRIVAFARAVQNITTNRIKDK
jgi:hypothetical protein